MQLEALDRDLYEDLCTGNEIVPNLERLTKEQVQMLVSLRMNGVTPQYNEEGGRTWKVPRKKKHGGHLTQGFAKKFFTSEN